MTASPRRASGSALRDASYTLPSPPDPSYVRGAPPPTPPHCGGEGRPLGSSPLSIAMGRGRGGAFQLTRASAIVTLSLARHPATTPSVATQGRDWPCASATS